jgi:hypothetical protein
MLVYGITNMPLNVKHYPMSMTFFKTFVIDLIITIPMTFGLRLVKIENNINPKFKIYILFMV